MRSVIDKIFEWLFAAIVVLAVLPCIVSIVIHTLGPVLITVGFVAVVIGVYRSLDRGRGRTTKGRNSGGGERKPILPRGDE
jgi:hypothetical protein